MGMDWRDGISLRAVGYHGMRFEMVCCWVWARKSSRIAVCENALWVRRTASDEFKSTKNMENRRCQAILVPKMRMTWHESGYSCHFAGDLAWSGRDLAFGDREVYRARRSKRTKAA